MPQKLGKKGSLHKWLPSLLILSGLTNIVAVVAIITTRNIEPLCNSTFDGTQKEVVNSWKTYNSEYVFFKYPAHWIEKPKLIRGSGYTQEFIDPQNEYILTFSVSGNYNQETGKPYATIDEYVNVPSKFKTVMMDGLEGRQPLPNVNGENTNSVVFLSEDSKSIYSLSLQINIKNRNSQELFEQIISSFKSNLNDVKTAKVLVQDGSYYGPPYDPDLYQLKLDQSHYFFAKSDTVNLKDYLGKQIIVNYKEVNGIIMGEQQLVIVESVE